MNLPLEQLGNDFKYKILEFVDFNLVLQTSFEVREILFTLHSKRFKHKRLLVEWAVREGVPTLLFLETKGLVAATPFVLFNLAVQFDKPDVFTWLFETAFVPTNHDLKHYVQPPRTFRIYRLWNKYLFISAYQYENWIEYWMETSNIEIMNHLIAIKHFYHKMTSWNYRFLEYAGSAKMLSWWKQQFGQPRVCCIEYLTRASENDRLDVLQWWLDQGISYFVPLNVQTIRTCSYPLRIQQFWETVRC